MQLSGSRRSGQSHRVPGVQVTWTDRLHVAFSAFDASTPAREEINSASMIPRGYYLAACLLWIIPTTIGTVAVPESTTLLWLWRASFVLPQIGWIAIPLLVGSKGACISDSFHERQMCWQPAGWEGAGTHLGSRPARGVARHDLLCLANFTFGTIRYTPPHRPDHDPRTEIASVLQWSRLAHRTKSHPSNFEVIPTPGFSRLHQLA